MEETGRKEEMRGIWDGEEGDNGRKIRKKDRGKEEKEDGEK